MYVDQPGKLELTSNRYKFLVNTAHLVQCTNIVFARKFKAGDMKRFEAHYLKYSNAVAQLFEGIKIQPNHHFSLHIPQQMAAWGPLAGVSEFPGERLIGFLQKISTNNKITEMHKTMMTRGFQDDDDSGTRQRLRSIRLGSSRYDLLLKLVEKQDWWVLSGDVVPIQSIDCNGLVVGSMAPRDCVAVLSIQQKGWCRWGIHGNVNYYQRIPKGNGGRSNSAVSLFVVPIWNGSGSG
ncbi:hypothetical protein VP01_545g8 [Puccinia sorghi]|uniref:Uncharacterized protein n=1 Tax=Puccinia sorghi TaxID=27349 RepID=A0A0L6UJK3_9BASI|nr:hypothetical protein VP01_545g8 [Puccinia sorghi]